MAQVSDVSLANQGFSAYRTEHNNINSALNSTHIGSSRPASAVAGTLWIDNSSDPSWTVYIYDGSDDIQFAIIDTTANTINFIDSVVTGINILTDTSPQLGGDLDVNSNSFVSTSNGNIQFTPNGTGKILFDNVAYSPTGTLTDGATVSWDSSAIQVAQLTLGGNRTLSAPTNLINGAFYALILIQDGTGGRTLTFNSVFKFTGATAPTLTATASARDTLIFQSDGTNLYEVGRSLNIG